MLPWHAVANEGGCMSGDAQKRAHFIRSAKSGAELEPYVEKVLELLLEEKELCLVDVNVPEKPRRIRWTRPAVKQYDGKVVPGKDPMKRAIYWFTIKPLEGEEEGTDRWAFGKNFVSITPLRLDLTDEKDLARVLALPITPARTARRKPPAKSTKRNSSR
jgi:broad specificity polyphosphatase/5'/3'-nucleotidase SurE